MDVGPARIKEMTYRMDHFSRGRFMKYLSMQDKLEIVPFDARQSHYFDKLLIVFPQVVN